MKGKPALFGAFLLAIAPSACVGTTGGDLFEFKAYAAGPARAHGTLSFDNGHGFHVQLSEARLLVGGLYLNRSRPTSVSADTSCSLAGIYVAEVLSGREIDLLSGDPQAFPNLGFATSDVAQTGEVWLAKGDVNETESQTTILRVSGTAERDGESYPFTGELSIGENRAPPATDPALPGQHPICKQRIVSPIPVNLKPRAGASLLLRVDPRAMFANVDFTRLTATHGVYAFADESGADPASDNLYAGLRRSTGVYSFSWLEEK
jgi:hypothetical protein